VIVAHEDLDDGSRVRLEPWDRCGTRAGVSYHYRHASPLCGRCRQALAGVNREYRQALARAGVKYVPPERSLARRRAQSRARNRALAALAREHPARYEALLAAHPGLYAQLARGRALGDLRREYPERFAALYAASLTCST
jgi:ribosomal protein L34E